MRSLGLAPTLLLIASGARAAGVNGELSVQVVPPNTSGSADGSTITPSGGGSLVNSVGTWTFDGAQSGGDHWVLLNGSQTAVNHVGDLITRCGGTGTTMFRQSALRQ